MEEGDECDPEPAPRLEQPKLPIKMLDSSFTCCFKVATEKLSFKKSDLQKRIKATFCLFVIFIGQRGQCIIFTSCCFFFLVLFIHLTFP